MNFTWNKILLLCCLLFIFIRIQAQNTVADSLENELSMHLKKDTTRVLLLNDAAYGNYGLDQAKMKKYAEEANTLSIEIGFEKGEARSWYLKALYHLVKRELEEVTVCIDKSLSLNKKIDSPNGIASCYSIIGTLGRFEEDYEKSILFYNKAIEIWKDNNEPLKVAGVLSSMGAVLNTQGEFDEGVTILKESIAIYDSLNEKTKVLNALNNLALIYSQQGRQTEALGYYQKCLTGYREQGNKIFGAGVLLNISLVYSTIGEVDKALPYLEESLELSKEIDNDLYVSKSIIGLGYVYRYKKEYDKALKYYKEGLDISNKIDSKEGQYNCYNNIAGLHLDKEEFELALKYYKKGLEVSLALGSKTAIAGSYTELGVVYYNLGDYKKALENSLKGKEIADELSLVITQKESSHFLSKLYEEKNNYKKALANYKEYKMYNDSLINEEQVRKITELEYDYKYKQELDAASIRELKLTETVKTTAQNLQKSQRNLLLGVIAFLLMALVLGSIIFFLKLRNEKSKTQNIIMEQKLLRLQMTPHFIFNSLSVLQGMILNKENKKANSYLSKFSKLLRITLENSRDKMVPLSQELTAIENYLELQNLEVSESYQYTVLVDDALDKSVYEIPPMLIQPFIENAIEHGFKDRKENKKIDVRLKYLNNDLTCTITDNGIGIDAQVEKQKQNQKSLATTITSERLQMLSKEFKLNGSITIEDRQKYNEQGTLVTLVIPYKTN